MKNVLAPGLSFQRLPVAVLLVGVALVSACRRDMQDQPKYEPYEASRFFKDNQSSRRIVDGTVPRGYLKEDAHLYTGKMSPAGVDAPGASGGQNVEGAPRAGSPLVQPGEGAPTILDAQTHTSAPALVSTFPFPVTRQVLDRGQERFNIYCSVCHGMIGVGDGMVVRRGFMRPPSLHEERLREAPVGHFYDVITNGFGAMPSYDSMIPVQDRWAIIAYVRALQLSRNMPLSEVPPEVRRKLEKGSP